MYDTIPVDIKSDWTREQVEHAIQEALFVDELKKHSKLGKLLYG